MKNIFLCLSSLIIACSVSTGAQAKNFVRVMAIGSSPKGQYIAFEEFGYQSGRTLPFSKIRIMNMWKNKYITAPIFITAKTQEDDLEGIRSRAKIQAKVFLKKYNISI